jgi:hypothetical protein
VALVVSMVEAEAEAALVDQVLVALVAQALKESLFLWFGMVK